ncbi:MAG: AMP-binding protein, partial [Pseudomonadota bacterium]
MSETIYPVPPEWSARAWVDESKYQEMYEQSIRDPDGFWGEMGKRIDWIKAYTKVKNTSYDPHNVSIKWYEDGTLNVCANCVDRHIATRGDQVAIAWEGDDPTEDERITYNQLLERVAKFANVMLANGVKKGDRVTIYMPMIPEAAYAMLACARIGAVHSVVFGGFSADSLADRLLDAESTFVVTADEGIRGGRKIPLKANTDAAISKTGRSDIKVLVTWRTGGDINWDPSRDLWLHEELMKVTSDCPPVEMSAEDPLFILYTSGSTGKPKGVLHTTGGYITWASMTHQYVFDYHDGDVYWHTLEHQGCGTVCQRPINNIT